MMQKMVTVLETDWGYMKAIWTDMGLWQLEFPVGSKPKDEETERLEDVVFWSEQLEKELNMYWRGFITGFGVPIDWRGYTCFQAAVLKRTASISHGKTTTYGALAEEVGSPKAARAVGGALHRNRVPIVIPCHRVVGSNGNLTGFAGGLEFKRALLLLESSGE